MTDKCIHHPGRESVVVIDRKAYCLQCQQEQANTVQNVDPHVEPKDCFVWYKKKDTWSEIAGTGCAHYVAHNKMITTGLSHNKCLKGFTLKINDLIQGRREINSLSDVQQNDIYVTPDKQHCGLVSKIKILNGVRQLSITHASSRQHKVATNDFNTYFHGKGTFYR